MLSVNIGKVDLNLPELDNKIRNNIPFGIEVNKKPAINTEINHDVLDKMCKRIGVNPDYALCSIGTLGSGNHFIEVSKSQNTDEIWITIHSGSRNFGKRVCDYWQKVANDDINIPKKDFFTEEVKRIRTLYRGSEIDGKVKELKAKLFMNNVPNDMSFLQGQHAKDYLNDMYVVNSYAKLNRFVILSKIVEMLNVTVQQEIETVHNFIDKDDIIRKGAIRSYKGELMIIPMNMRDGILLCEGKSNPDWNFSAPHGAGRVLGRAQAKKLLDLDKFKADMDGIYSTSIGETTLDEAPDAYKNSKLIEEAIGPTATIIDRLIPIMNLKDN